MAHASAPGPLTFGHATVADEQNPGDEPDVKVAPNGSIYTSSIAGSSTGTSYLSKSTDHGNSYQFVPGNLATGKPTTCIGGGDTDLWIDPDNWLYFSDLQAFSNISNSDSADGGKTWGTNCLGAPNTPVDRMWFTGEGSSAGKNLRLFQEYDAVDSKLNPGSGSPIGNELVESMSTNGTNFVPVLNQSALSLTPSCIGLGLANCMTDNEGIPGPQVLDPHHSNNSNANIYTVHTNTSGGVTVTSGSVNMTGSLPTAKWVDGPDLVAPLKGASRVSELFPSIAEDQAGYLYVVFTAATAGGSEKIYMSHSTTPAPADPSQVTWTAPEPITGSGLSAGTSVFPWVTAGSDGRVAVAYYHTPTTATSGKTGAENLTNAEWDVQATESLNAHDPSSSWTTSPVSEAPTKFGQIALGGTTGEIENQDRSLGDFMQVSTDPAGRLVVSYVDDTSQDTVAGSNAGPPVVSRQLSGPSLYADRGDLGSDGGPDQRVGSTGDPTGDAAYSNNGSLTPASPNLDLTGASLQNVSGGDVLAKINVKSLSSLSPAANLGGPDASWILRWKVVSPGQVGNGHVYYVGMDSNLGGGPKYFFGDTAAFPPVSPGVVHAKDMTFPQKIPLTQGDTNTPGHANYDPASGVVTFRVPRSDFGNLPDGTVFYSATAFTSTQATPQSAATLFNTIDSTPPIDFVLCRPGANGANPLFSENGMTSGDCAAGGSPVSSTTSTKPVGKPQQTHKPKPTKDTWNGKSTKGCPKPGHSIDGTRVGFLTLGISRAHSRRVLRKWNTHRRPNMDYYCVQRGLVRAAYGYKSLLAFLPHKQYKLAGRALWIVTGNPHYSLSRVRPRMTLKQVRRLHRLSHPIKLGTNTWYVFPTRKATGVIKFHRGRVYEIGLANRSLTTSFKSTRLLLNSFAQVVPRAPVKKEPVRHRPGKK
ncbi:MAG: hypothetical protein J2O48_06250 [Solirubrobacterales bacterium]|nr:hypothetical protein [Solirubrobacterales bacterium]